MNAQLIVIAGDGQVDNLVRQSPRRHAPMGRWFDACAQVRSEESARTRRTGVDPRSDVNRRNRGATRSCLCGNPFLTQVIPFVIFARFFAVSSLLRQLGVGLGLSDQVRKLRRIEFADLQSAGSISPKADSHQDEESAFAGKSA